jgi:hypothetical protein
MPTEDWELFKVFADRFEAERVVGLLESSGVPAYVNYGDLGVGLDMKFSVFVDATLAHRARWVMASAPEVTDAELEFLATGKLPGSDEPKEP